MTALATSRFGLPFAVAPAKPAREQKRSISWSEPEPWIVAVLLATGVAVIARHPIARAIGTEADQPTLTPSVVATAPPTAAAYGSDASSAGAMVAPVPTHAPRDPFHALVKASQALLDQSSIGATAGVTIKGSSVTVHYGTAQPVKSAAATTPAATTPAATAPAATTPAPAAAASGTCAGTVHTVVAGDTLWSIAAKVVKSSDVGRVNVAWHRIYAANQPPLGNNPSLVPVGTKLCIPSSV